MSAMDRAAAVAFADLREPRTRPVAAIQGRQRFLHQLSEVLGTREIAVLDAELGTERDRPLWLLTLQLPNQQVIAVRARVDNDVDPVAVETCEDIAARVIRHAF